MRGAARGPPEGRASAHATAHARPCAVPNRAQPGNPDADGERWARLRVACGGADTPAELRRARMRGSGSIPHGGLDGAVLVRVGVAGFGGVVVGGDGGPVARSAVGVVGALGQPGGLQLG